MKLGRLWAHFGRNPHSGLFCKTIIHLYSLALSCPGEGCLTSHRTTCVLTETKPKLKNKTKQRNHISHGRLYKQVTCFQEWCPILIFLFFLGVTESSWYCPLICKLTVRKVKGSQLHPTVNYQQGWQRPGFLIMCFFFPVHKLSLNKSHQSLFSNRLLKLWEIFRKLH